MGSLLSLTRLLANISREPEEAQAKFIEMARKMYQFVDLPSMCLSIFFGMVLLFLTSVDLLAGWFHMKITFAVLLIVCDILTGVAIYRTAEGFKSKKKLQYKILHGLTVLFLLSVLFSIYVIRNKEKEIIERYQTTQETTRKI
ncbi:MAG: CopD family protein [Chlamydiia bacterium]|nr:CopD family protein [Chlamydiia bacterium]